MVGIQNLNALPALLNLDSYDCMYVGGSQI